MIMAARNGNSRVLALLLKHNGNADAVDTSGNTALHNAAAYGWLQCVQFLVRYGAETSPENAWKFTPLTIALLKNHIAIVQELMKSEDINVNTKDDEGRTILSLAVSCIT